MNATAIKQAVIAARKSTLSFYVSDYIDLYGFYQNLASQIAALRKKAVKGTAYAKALDTLTQTISQGMTLIAQAIFANSVGSADAAAKGLSIYYFNPTQAATAIDASYVLTLFAQQSLWLSFIKEYRG